MKSFLFSFLSFEILTFIFTVALGNPSVSSETPTIYYQAFFFLTPIIFLSLLKWSLERPDSILMIFLQPFLLGVGQLFQFLLTKGIFGISSFYAANNSELKPINNINQNAVLYSEFLFRGITLAVIACIVLSLYQFLKDTDKI